MTKSESRQKFNNKNMTYPVESRYWTETPTCDCKRANWSLSAIIKMFFSSSTFILSSGTPKSVKIWGNDIRNQYKHNMYRVIFSLYTPIHKVAIHYRYSIIFIIMYILDLFGLLMIVEN